MKKSVARWIGSIAIGFAIGVVGFINLLSSVHNPAGFRTFFLNLALPFVSAAMHLEWPEWTAWASFGASVALWSAIVDFVRRRLE